MNNQDKNVIERFDKEFPVFAEGQFGDYTQSPIPHLKSFLLSEIHNARKEERDKIYESEVKKDFFLIEQYLNVPDEDCGKGHIQRDRVLEIIKMVKEEAYKKGQEDTATGALMSGAKITEEAIKEFKVKVGKELDSLTTRTNLYCLTDKIIINQRANDRGDITPQQRDEMNIKLFNKFRVELLQEILNIEI